MGIFRLNISSRSIQLFPWKEINIDKILEDQILPIETILQSKIVFSTAINPNWLQTSPQSPTKFNFETTLEDHIKKTPPEIFKLLLEDEEIAHTCNRLLDLLRKSIRDRIEATPDFCKNCINSGASCNHPKIGILFSGGIDCTIIACLTDELLDEHVSIDLINVSFEKVSRGVAKGVKIDAVINYDTPDRISARESLNELKSRSKR